MREVDVKVINNEIYKAFSKLCFKYDESTKLKLIDAYDESEGREKKVLELLLENEKEDLVILKIERYVEELINYRKISFDIIWWNVTGLKVSNEAIHYEENNQELAYIIRKRVGYTDKIYVKVLKQSDKYSIIENYDDSSELTEKGVSKDEIENRKKIAMYDEVQL